MDLENPDLDIFKEVHILVFDFLILPNKVPQRK